MRAKDAAYIIYNEFPGLKEDNYSQYYALVSLLVKYGVDESSPVDQLVIRQKFTLEEIKADNTIMDELDKVLIWTDEHGAYWRENGGGYTWDKLEAGIYDIKDAYRRTKHCSEDKLIKFLSV